jgi:hypothetical protein
LRQRYTGSIGGVTAQELYVYFAIEIHMKLIGVLPERNWMMDAVYLPIDELPPAVCIGMACIQQIRCCFHSAS